MNSATPHLELPPPNQAARRWRAHHQQLRQVTIGCFKISLNGNDGWPTEAIMKLMRE
jgi:hypothetical protein